ncbi:MAG TPA: hydratase [Bacillota bacterium]|nr:hydratase [Bacillota bacterium]
MVELFGQNGVFLAQGKKLIENKPNLNVDEMNHHLSQAGLPNLTNVKPDPESARTQTIAYSILTKHNTSGDWRNLKIRYDALASHDITYVGIIQTARASGLKEFPVPYVLTNCHNSLCAVGGTINEDDHVFGLSAAEHYGGIYVPAHQAVIHQYMRETMAGCGKMILGSDSHTRYGALGTMAVGEGGPELVKQLLKRTYDIQYPEVIAVFLEGKPVPGVGPQDVALAIIKAVFNNGFVKNKVMEFVGPGVANLSVDYRNGIDVMTTETTCLSSIWMTDPQVEAYYKTHGRAGEYKQLEPGALAYYDGAIKVNLSKIEPMIALPFHPSNVYSIAELNRNAAEILKTVEAEGQKQLDNPKTPFRLTDKLVKGRLKVEQGVVAGCSGGTFENLMEMTAILNGRSIGAEEFALSIYPASQPVYLELIKNGAAAKLLTTGATIRSAFCGPCFGAGDVPAHNALSIRHTTRNFPNREGSKPTNNQLASVALMDARSIAATALNHGLLTPATEVATASEVARATEVAGSVSNTTYTFDRQVYENRVFQGFGSPKPEKPLKFGPNIADWPRMIPLTKNILLKMVSVIHDPVTTTDELIPSGETSSYRSNPLKLAEFTLSRKDPGYVARAKDFQALELKRRQHFQADNSSKSAGDASGFEPILELLISAVAQKPASKEQLLADTGFGSVIFAVKPGDGSAREQAASCQKVLGGWANIAVEYATKRYRSNLINWGMLPFTIEPGRQKDLAVDDYLFIPNIYDAVKNGDENLSAFLIKGGEKQAFPLKLANLSPEERAIILAGCLINYYAEIPAK